MRPAEHSPASPLHKVGKLRQGRGRSFFFSPLGVQLEVLHTVLLLTLSTVTYSVLRTLNGMGIGLKATRGHKRASILGFAQLWKSKA